MNLLCIFGHKWKNGIGCICERCGEIRHLYHYYITTLGKCEEKCKYCGDTRPRHHEWFGCKCKHCGEVRDESHRYISIQDKCIEKCAICGAEREGSHLWDGCKCLICGKYREEKNDLYFIGELDYSHPCYWINGKLITLNTENGIGSVYGATLYDDKILIYGRTENRFCYWINNELFHIKNRFHDNDKIILNSGNDDYYIGVKHNGYKGDAAYYWKNTVEVALDKKEDESIHISVAEIHNGNLYIAGYVSRRIPSFRYGPTFTVGDYNTPCYWINGERIKLENTPNFYGAKITSMFFFNNDIYFGGSRENWPCYWKNSKKIELAPSSDEEFYGRVNAISIINGDVYCVGKYDNRPCYWINGKAFPLDERGEITSIMTIKNDIYFAGFAGDVLFGKPCYWRNNELYYLDIGYANHGKVLTSICKQW
jgi:hypothetical protein